MTIHFPDLSHHKQVSLDGALALITKATQGLSFVDPSYATYKADADRRGIPFAGYHWVDTSDLGKQAALAWRVMGGVPCMWDAEAAGATVPRLAELTRRYRDLGGNPRLVYLPRWWWRDHLGSPSLKPLMDEGLALVSSAYPAAGYSDTGFGWQAYGGMTPVIWQYTDAHLFNGQLVDFNAFKGTVDELRHLFTGQPPSSLQGDQTMAQMLVRFTDATDPNQVWLCDGQFRRRVKPEWLGNGTGPISNVQVHQPGLLGPLSNGGKVFTSAGDADVWGLDVATLGGGAFPHTHAIPPGMIPATDTGPASTG